MKQYFSKIIIFVVGIILGMLMSIVIFKPEDKIRHYLVPMISPDSSGEWNTSALQKAIDIAASNNFDIIIPK